MSLLPDKSLTRTVLKMSTPAVAGLSFQVVVSMFETAMVGRLDNAIVVLAAIGLGNLATWAITSVFSSFATGTQVLVARRYGERDYAGAGDVLNNSLLLSLGFGIAIGALGFLYSFHILNFFASDSAVAVAGTGYMKLRFLGLILFLVVVSYRGFFNGIGHTKVFMYSAIVIGVSNMLFSYLLIFGVFGLPRLGLTGAGAAYALSNAVGTLFFFTASILPRYRRRFGYFRRLRILRNLMAQILKISAPVSFQNILILLGFLVFMAITGVVGTAQQAASQVVVTALFMSFLPCFGFGIGAQTLVGQTMGKGESGLAKRYGYEAARLATYFTVVLGVVFILVPDWVIILITTNKEVTDIARPVLRVAGAAQVFYASGIVLAYSLQAAGATVYVMFIEVLTHWIIFLPISYLVGVTFGGGIVGTWLAMPLYILSYTLLIFVKYRSGSWLHLKL